MHLQIHRRTRLAMLKALSCEQKGRTALMLACWKGHSEVAMMLVAPTHAAGALDCRCNHGHSAFQWAEQTCLVAVMQEIRALGGGVVSSHPIVFGGLLEDVELNLNDQTVSFGGGNAVVRSRQRCPMGDKGYYEIEILGEQSARPAFGLCTKEFPRTPSISHLYGPRAKSRLGDNDMSWVVSQDWALNKRHNGVEERIGDWRRSVHVGVGDVIGVVCDLISMQMLFSVNGNFDPPKGRVFDLAPEAVGDGLFAIFSDEGSGAYRYNMGEAPFKFPPEQSKHTGAQGAGKGGGDGGSVGDVEGRSQMGAGGEGALVGLVDMGFTEEQATESLQKFRGSAERAVDWLVSGEKGPSAVEGGEGSGIVAWEGKPKCEEDAFDLHGCRAFADFSIDDLVVCDSCVIKLMPSGTQLLSVQSPFASPLSSSPEEISDVLPTAQPKMVRLVKSSDGWTLQEISADSGVANSLPNIHQQFEIIRRLSMGLCTKVNRLGFGYVL